VGRIRLLVEDHLLCERLDAGGYPVRVEAVGLAEAVEAAIGRGAVARVALTQAIEPGLVARADRLLLERALDGLLGAAARDGTTVSLVARRLAGPGAELEVRIQGAPPQTLEDLHKGAPSDQSGRTLAPAMARRVAAALGGALTVDAEAYLLRIPAA
jgi:hypothetical protein